MRQILAYLTAVVGFFSGFVVAAIAVSPIVRLESAFMNHVLPTFWIPTAEQADRIVDVMQIANQLAYVALGLVLALYGARFGYQAVLGARDG